MAKDPSKPKKHRAKVLGKAQKPKPKGHFSVNTVGKNHGVHADELHVTESGCLVFYIKSDPNPVLVVSPGAYAYVLGGAVDNTGTETPENIFR